MRQQNAQHGGGSQQAPTMRRNSGSQRAQTRATMSTEYQERFLPPHCHTTLVSTTTQKDPYHPLKATGADMTTFRSYYVTHKWIKKPPKAPQLPAPPKVHQRCTSAPQNNPLLRFAEKQMASKVEDYTSVYKSDFQAWKAKTRQPYKLSDSLKVNQGLVAPNSPKGRSEKNSAHFADNSKSVPQVPEPQPFESMTSYRSDYVTHPLQPRIRREKPAYKPRGLPFEPIASSRPKVAWDTNEEVFDTDFFQKFKTWSLETKFHGQGKAKESGPAADHEKFLSTTHADHTTHKCQRTKPVLPSMQSREKSKEPLQTTTTMKEDYKAWDTPQRLPTVHKEKPDCPKKTTFSLCPPAESCKTNPKPGSLHPKANETKGCNSGCNATHKPQSPDEGTAFSGFECISNGNEESRRYWTTSMGRGVTWADGEICEDPSEAHQLISCRVSGRN